MDRNTLYRLGVIASVLAGVGFIVLAFLADSSGVRILWGIVAALWWFSLATQRLAQRRR